MEEPEGKNSTAFQVFVFYRLRILLGPLREVYQHKAQIVSLKSMMLQQPLTLISSKISGTLRESGSFIATFHRLFFKSTFLVVRLGWSMDKTGYMANIGRLGKYQTFCCLIRNSQVLHCSGSWLCFSLQRKTVQSSFQCFVINNKT